MMPPKKEREETERKGTETEYSGKKKKPTVFVLGQVKEQSIERSSEEKQFRGAIWRGKRDFQEEEMVTQVGAIGDVMDFIVAIRVCPFMNSSLIREPNKGSTGVMDGENLELQDR